MSCLLLLLLLCPAAAHPTSSSPIPLIHVSACTHYDAGHQLGVSRAVSWRQYMYGSNASYFTRTIAPFMHTQPQALAAWLNASRVFYPHVVAEMQGMSDGSGIAFEDLFALNCTAEIDYLSYSASSSSSLFAL